jgi:Uma2 family endonuclease
MVLRAAPDAPPLESGDVMTRRQFHELYSLHPEIKKAELIQGVVYVASPQRAQDHGDHEGDISFWLGLYRWQHLELPLNVAHNSTVFLNDINEPQPDISLRLEGGTSGLEDGYILGPPELIVEVAYSSVSRDLHSKKDAYRLNGVPEYIVWRVRDRAIDWFRLESGQYVRLEPDADGVVHSVVFPGLRLNVPAMLAKDLGAVAKTQTGIEP